MVMSIMSSLKEVGDAQERSSIATPTCLQSSLRSDESLL